MIKILLVFVSFALINFSFNFVSLVSNEWYSIFIRNNNCQNELMDSCLLPGFKRTMTVGYWYACPTDTGLHSTWVFRSSLKQNCVFMKSHDRATDRLKFPNIFAAVLKNTRFLDIEVEYSDVIQALELIGSVILLLICIIIIGILTYISVTVDRSKEAYIKDLYRSNENLFDLEWGGSGQNIREKKKFYSVQAEFEFLKPYLQLIFALHLLEFFSRLSSFIIYTIRALKYLDSIIRTSYSISTGNNYYNTDFDIIVTRIGENYRISMNWTFWMYVASLGLSLGSLVLVVVYYIYNLCKIWWDFKMVEKNEKRINDFILNENQFNRYPVPFEPAGLPVFNAESLNNSVVSFNWLQNQQQPPMQKQEPYIEAFVPDPRVLPFQRDEYFNLSSDHYFQSSTNIAIKTLVEQRTDQRIMFPKKLNKQEQKYFDDLFRRNEPKKRTKTAKYKEPLENIKPIGKTVTKDLSTKINEVKEIPEFEEAKEVILPETPSTNKIKPDEVSEDKSVRFLITKSQIITTDIEVKHPEPIDDTIQTDTLEEASSNRSSLDSVSKYKEYNLGDLNEDSKSLTDFSDSFNSNIYNSISSESVINIENQETNQSFQKIIIREKAKKT